MHKSIFKAAALLLAVAVLLAACQPAAPTDTAPVTEAPITLRIALIPVLDALPIYVAQSQGLFAKYGVAVEFIPVKSAPERDQLIAAKGADGMVNELLSAMFFNREQVQVQVVRYAQAASSEAALFRIVAAPGSAIASAPDLKGVQIGISEGTVIEYITDRLLEAEGFTPDEIATIAVPDINARMTLLSSGELQAAVLPEPLSSLVVLQGGTVPLDDTAHPEFSFSTLTFRKEVIDAHPAAIRQFLAAIEDAVAIINEDPAALRPFLSEQKLIPPPLAESFTPNRFITAGVPSAAQWQDVLDWALAKGLLENAVSYSDSVTAEFLP